MCMHVAPLKPKLNDGEMILISLPLILAGGIIGIACARAVPASTINEVSMGVGAILLLSIFLVRRKKEGRSLPDDSCDRIPCANSSSDTDSLSVSSSFSSSSGSDESAESEPLTQCEPCDGNLRETSLPESSCIYESSARHSREERPQVSEESPHASTSIPIHIRVEQEKLRISRTKGHQDHVGVKATAHNLRFQDNSGRNIRYRLRPSKKKSRATILELLIEDKKVRKVKNIIYDEEADTIYDGKNMILIPPSDVSIVIKRLSLLCKVGSVKLDWIDASPTLSTVLSNLDCNGSTTRKVLSSSCLSGQ